MCLADNEQQISEMAEVIEECPNLKVAIGHFGMANTSSFKSQVMLARKGRQVRIESGGITWLFHSEFYPYPSAIRKIREAAEWVGDDKIMWGATIPARSLPLLTRWLTTLSGNPENSPIL